MPLASAPSPYHNPYETYTQRLPPQALEYSQPAHTMAMVPTHIVPPEPKIKEAPVNPYVNGGPGREGKGQKVAGWFGRIGKGISPNVHNWAKLRGNVVGRVWVVTGASSGMGRGVAERAGWLGAKVVLAARRTEALMDVAQTIHSYGGEAIVVPTDVADAAALERLGEVAAATFGHVDVWLNIAGLAPVGHAEDIPAADVSRLVDVNVKGVMFGSQVAIRHFKAQGFGTLVNMASVEGRVPIAYHAFYAGTKGAVIAMDAALREELRHAGLDRVRVVSIEPWAVDTPFWGNGGDYTGRELRTAPMMDDAQTVADSIVWAAVNAPSGEFPVGPKAAGAVMGARFAPHFSARMAGNINHRQQYGKPIPAKYPTSGALHAPSPAPPTVDGGFRRRNKM